MNFKINYFDKKKLIMLKLIRIIYYKINKNQVKKKVKNVNLLNY